jgi:hypothetical protein
MQQFQNFLTALFAAITNFAKGSNRTLQKVISLLVQVKNQSAATAQGLVDTNTTVAGVRSDVTSLQTTVTKLSQVKGNFDVLPYDYSKDANPLKPSNGVSAMDLFSYVTAKLGIAPVNGKTYQIQYSGSQSIPTTVDGVLESGDPDESLMVMISDAGQYSFVYQSDENAEKFAYIGTKADETSVALGTEQAEQARLEGLLDALLAPTPNPA